nr:agmatine deiminase family protein [uncultured Bacteroides sp.]
MKILKRTMDYVFFSENLKRYYPKVYNELTEILSKHDVCYGILKGTADYWCRDYMPVQVDSNSFVQFQYHPDYLKELRDYETPTETSIGLAKLLLPSSSICVSSIVADGGNFTFASIKKGRGYTPVVVMTEKIFIENPDIDRKNLVFQLEKLFPNHKFLFLPWDRSDTCGHTDGILHAVGNNKVLVNLKVYPDDIAAKMRNELELYFKVIDLELSNYHNMSWAYINMIHTQNVIIVPGIGLSTDKEALKHIKKLFPEYEDKIYQVQMPSIVKRGGALNCISWTFTI